MCSRGDAITFSDFEREIIVLESVGLRLQKDVC